MLTDWLVRPLRSVLSVLSANDSSRQVAAGAAIGVVLGLVPKANLLAAALGVMLCALRVNRTAGLCSAALVGMIAPMIDPLTHKLGLRVLTAPSLQGAFAWLYEAPLGPWIGFHNTVTTGSLLLGLYLAYPVYLVVRAMVDRVRPPVVRWACRYRIGRWLLGVELTERLGGLV